MRKIHIAASLALAAVAVSLAACSNQPDPCGAVFSPDGKVTPTYCSSTGNTVDPKFALIGIGIVCGTILVLAFLAFAHSLSTHWRHADDEGGRRR